jgi:hypothetical protein
MVPKCSPDRQNSRLVDGIVLPQEQRLKSNGDFGMSRGQRCV